jgi:sugar phosphate isomerase/epimerase
MMVGLSDHPSLGVKLGDFLDFSSQLGAEHVEIKLDRPSLLSTLVEDKAISMVKDSLASYNFKCFLHAPSIDVNPASLNPKLGKASEENLLTALSFAGEVNAMLLVSHVGRLSRDYPQNLVRKALENAIARLKRVADSSRDAGIIFTIENDHKTSDHLIAGYPKQVLSLLREIDCKLTFDVGHANTLGKIEDFFETLRTYMVNIHLHANNGVDDQHLPLSEGKMQINEILEKVKKSNFQPPLTLECHSIEGLHQDYNLLQKLLQ